MAIGMHGESPMLHSGLVRTRGASLWLLSVMLAAAGCGASSVTYLAGPTAKCDASLPSSYLSAGSTGGRFDASVTAARECSWTASSDASWIQVSPQTGQGNVMLSVTVSANPDTRERTGVIVIAEESLVVVQAAAPATPPSSTPETPPSTPESPPSTPPSTPGCSYTLSPSSENVGKNGGTETFDVKTTAACGWTVSTSTPWITLLTLSGTGNGTVGYVVARNTGNSDRTGAISVAGKVFAVTQKK